MFLRALKLRGFRNLKPLLLEPGPRFNVLSGNNGQGKTNLLEAVYTVCTLRSFRTSRLADMVSIEEDQAFVQARVSRDGLERIYDLSLRKQGGRTAKLDGKAARPIAQYFGQFNVVLFAPEDLQVPRGSPSDRRKFLDRAVFNWQPGYLPRIQQYEKLLKNRNALLRQIQSGEIALAKATPLLDVFDLQLGTLGARVTVDRLQFLEELRPRFEAGFESITRFGLPVGIDYQAPAELLEVTTANSANVDEVAAAITATATADRRRDLARGTTSTGPHRHDILFTLAGQAAATFASQGQLRAMVLAFKTAELTLLTEKRRQAPVLLLDDVSSELDPDRNQFLFEFLASHGSQCFITTTHPNHVHLSENRVDYQVSGGAITLQNKD